MVVFGLLVFGSAVSFGLGFGRFGVCYFVVVGLGFLVVFITLVLMGLFATCVVVAFGFGIVLF